MKAEPPFLHWMGESRADLVKDRIREVLGRKVAVRLIDGSAAANLEGLGKELGRSIRDRPIAGIYAALDDVMQDVHWAGGGKLVATVYIIDNAANILRNVPAGMATWGNMAERWAHAWAKTIDEGEVWDHAPIPLHFVHCAKVLPREAPNMSRFEMGAE